VRISFNQIADFLKIQEIDFSLRGKVNSNYKISSLFYPESNGFYFLNGGMFIPFVENSLFMSSSDIELNEGNALIIFNENPQVIYYKLLDYYFKEQSSGKICKTVILHDEVVIGKNVQIDPYVILGKCNIGDNTIIKSHTVVADNSIIGKNVILEPHCTIGATGAAWVWGENDEKIRQPQLGGVVIKDNCFIGANSAIVKGSLNENTSIGKNTIIAPGAKIGHGTQIGENVHLANNVATGGNTRILDFCFIGSSVTFRPQVSIHPYTVVGTGTVVIKNTSKENVLLMGVPAKETSTKNSLAGVPNYKK
jgi:UDP-3-O-[3-hydroxymyristoyl] glucosamine N-acyltransferase